MAVVLIRYGVHGVAGLGIALRGVISSCPRTQRSPPRQSVRHVAGTSVLRTRLCDVRVSMWVEGECFRAIACEAVDSPVTGGCGVWCDGRRTSRLWAHEPRTALRRRRQCTRKGDGWERVGVHGGWAARSRSGCRRVGSD